MSTKSSNTNMKIFAVVLATCFGFALARSVPFNPFHTYICPKSLGPLTCPYNYAPVCVVDELDGNLHITTNTCWECTDKERGYSYRYYEGDCNDIADYVKHLKIDK